MRTALTILFVFLVACGLVVYGAVRAVEDVPHAYVIGQGSPEVSAYSWGVYDTVSGIPLFEHEVEEVHPIASLTKLMTAAVAVDTLALEASTTLSWRAVSTEGRAGRLSYGEDLSIRELLFPLLIESSNDAAEAIAEYQGRPEFIEMMNAHARTLGMTETTFVDPSGLSPQNVSTVSNLSRLVSHMEKSEAYVLDITSLPTYIGAEHMWWNVNPLVAESAFRGGKHGYTDEARRTFAGIFNETVSSGEMRQLTIILLGSEDLRKDTESIRTFIRDHIRYE